MEQARARHRIEAVLLDNDYMLVGMGKRALTLAQLIDKLIDAARGRRP